MYRRLLTKVQLGVVPCACKEDESKGQDGNQEHIENAEEDEAGSDANAVAAIGQTKCDGVQKPEQVDPRGEQSVVAGYAYALS